MATRRGVHLTDSQWAKIEPLLPRRPDLLLVLESKSLKRLYCESRASHKNPYSQLNIRLTTLSPLY